MAPAGPAPGDAPRTSDREGGDGAQAGCEFVVDVAEREARFAGSKIRLSYCSDQGFDSVAKVTEFADHSVGAVAS